MTMGQHTWFYKDQELRKKELELWERLDSHEDGDIWLEDIEIIQINYEIDIISKQNDADYHDLFRTDKRNKDGTYTDDIIYSKKECDQWLEENKELVRWGDEEVCRKLLNEFWEKYPKGAIDFG
jgi:hypothetical protein